MNAKYIFQALYLAFGDIAGCTIGVLTVVTVGEVGVFLFNKVENVKNTMVLSSFPFSRDQLYTFLEVLLS